MLTFGHITGIETTAQHNWCVAGIRLDDTKRDVAGFGLFGRNPFYMPEQAPGGFKAM